MKNTLRRRLLSRAALLMVATSAIVLPLSVQLIGRAFARVEGHAAVADAKRVELVLDGATREARWRTPRASRSRSRPRPIRRCR